MGAQRIGEPVNHRSRRPLCAQESFESHRSHSVKMCEQPRNSTLLSSKGSKMYYQDSSNTSQAVLDLFMMSKTDQENQERTAWNSHVQNCNTSTWGKGQKSGRGEGSGHILNKSWVNSLYNPPLTKNLPKICLQIKAFQCLTGSK